MRNESLVPLNSTLMAFPSLSDSVQWTWCASLQLALGGTHRITESLLWGNALGSSSQGSWCQDRFGVLQQACRSSPGKHQHFLQLALTASPCCHALSSWPQILGAVGWGCASLHLCLLPWETELRLCRFREEVKEGKQTKICFKSKPFDAGIA